MKMIKIEDLVDHPNNPRLFPCEETITQIASQINGKFDEAALLVRPLPKGNIKLFRDIIDGKLVWLRDLEKYLVMCVKWMT